ncbi:hypothetical protein K227x_64660 [Rubripirellula lacrimiformis]|uniref:3-oxo-tetronate kinase n=1 Tax=Rubripirellula lacrimiformis TaxID=1930273 RepID=A0A517NLM5_9BACT|nr:3-oxo-tetronate kinase [Rubripirellula lacrimiformis]QDT08036.1 hypothetical protein K227x_64660 [Rubripirellula lacrimiformis]
MNGPLIGCIADDFTGATDVAGLMRRSGMRVVQCFGIPQTPSLVDGFDAVVVALKSRSIDADLACQQSCDAAKWLQSIGTQRFFFKYCSTFDSTPAGNIGPVAEALMDCLDVPQTIFCPSFPENGRTVYQGHLFVGGSLLSESGMQHHPLNPMTDANLVRVLAGQSKQPVSLVTAPRDGEVSDGTFARRLADAGPLVITDAIDNDDLAGIATTVADHRLVTGGSAIAGFIAQVLQDRREPTSVTADIPIPSNGRSAVLAGSCSQATQAQVQEFVRDHPALTLDVERACRGEDVLGEAKRWVDDQSGDRPFLISSTVDPESLARIHAGHGRSEAAAVVESLLSELGFYLVQQGIRRLVVAGGETSGAIVERLGVEAIRIGDEIAPGVPWTESLGSPPIALALKSGNFGSTTFFRTAIGASLADPTPQGE